MPDAVLVTGGAGFAGRHLLQLLTSVGADLEVGPGRPAASAEATASLADQPPPRLRRSAVASAKAEARFARRPEGRPLQTIAAWRRPGGQAQTGTGRVRWIAVDLLDRDSVAKALAEGRPREIYHCAGAAHVGDSWNAVTGTLASNVLATHHLLTALRDLGLPSRVLIPGSAMVYRPREEPLDEEAPIGPISPYGISKLAQEQLGLRAWTDEGREVVLTRSFNHIGPGQDPSFSASGFARQIALIEAGLAEPVLRVGNLDSRRDLTDVRDTVRAYRSLMQRGRPGAIYNVCSGEAHPIRDVLDQLLALSRVPIAVRIDPSRYRPNDSPVIAGRADRLVRDTGWRPAWSLPRTLADLLDYWRRELRDRPPLVHSQP